ncbi:hypothetical protein L7F22_002723 [Adiantum nelumboides]|nr:hypothetical protein [Adiantum nelumboides]
MEIRRLKKVSCSGLLSVQQGSFKRTRPLRTSSICSTCNHSSNAKGDLDIFSSFKALYEQSSPFAVKFVAENTVPHAVGEGDVMRASGLIRSKSFPPECLQNGRCVLHIRKASRDGVVTDVGHIAAVVTEEQRGTLQEMSVEVSSQKAEVADADRRDEIPPPLHLAKWLWL